MSSLLYSVSFSVSGDNRSPPELVLAIRSHPWRSQLGVDARRSSRCHGLFADMDEGSRLGMALGTSVSMRRTGSLTMASARSIHRSRQALATRIGHGDELTIRHPSLFGQSRSHGGAEAAASGTWWENYGPGARSLCGGDVPLGLPQCRQKNTRHTRLAHAVGIARGALVHFA